MSFCLELLGVLLATLVALTVYRAVFPERCPRCRERGFNQIGAVHYHGRDVWGYRAGWCYVHHCRQCGLCLLRHHNGEDEISAGEWREAVDRIVFGKSTRWE